MIKANELRIGNWVYSPLMQGYFKISRLDDEHDPTCDPIPLTPEILERCGFRKKVGTNANSKAVYFDIYDECYRIYWSKDSTSFHLNAGDWFPKLTGMDYLHQLQNLYYALTGEELIHVP